MITQGVIDFVTTIGVTAIGGCITALTVWIVTHDHRKGESAD